MSSSAYVTSNVCLKATIGFLLAAVAMLSGMLLTDIDMEQWKEESKGQGPMLGGGLHHKSRVITTDGNITTYRDILKKHGQYRQDMKDMLAILLGHPFESFVETMDGPLACTCADTTCSRLISRQEPDNFDPVLSRTSFGKMVRISEDTFAVLKQNRVQFLPKGGTFIGAVRSGGIIPWDDDMDIYFEHISDSNVTTGMPQSIDNTAALQTSFAQLRAKGWKVLDGLNKEGEFSVCDDGRGGNSTVCLTGISWCRSNNMVTYRCALSITFKQDVERVFPLVWSKWHSSEISVPKNPLWFWQDVAMPDQREGKMTATDQWDTAMNNVAIRDRGHHKVKWKRHAEKRQISKIPFLSGYDPALWERTLPWRCTRRGDLSNKTVQVL